MTMRHFGRAIAVIAVGAMMTLSVIDTADARRASSGFGSRGTRTFSAPPVTRTAPTNATPIERSMTPRQATQPAANQTQPNQARPGVSRPGLFGGFGGSLIGGLMMGGLIGMLLGTGLGGGIGFLGLLLQMALLVGAVALAMRFFGRSQRPAAAGPAGGFARQAETSGGRPSFAIPKIGAASGSSAANAGPIESRPLKVRDISVSQKELDRFESMLKDVQAAYGAEDYSALRRLTTPEAMSYLAEELSENATAGVRNDVSNVHLVQGDVAEAWQEDGVDYVTVAMRYESIDVMRNRETGKIVSGDPDTLTESVELWTFTRKPSADWQVSAIQGVQGA